jgi:hypothetical protein
MACTLLSPVAHWTSTEAAQCSFVFACLQPGTATARHLLQGSLMDAVNSKAHVLVQTSMVRSSYVTCQ